MTSILAGTPFKKTELTYTIVKPDPNGGRDANGNPATIVETGTVLVILTARIRVPDYLQKQPGADDTFIPVIGELVSPLSFPAGVVLGTRFSGEYGGQAVELELTKIVPNDLPGISFGDYFEANMRVSV